MNEKPSQPEAVGARNARRDLKASLVESLMHSAYPTNDQQGDARIKAVLDKIQSDELAVVQSNIPRAVTKSVHHWKRWLAVGAALTFVVAMTFLFMPHDSPVQAMSVLERSIVAAKESISRKYRLSITRRGANAARRTIESDLYVEGSDRIVIRYPHPLFQKSFWLGKNGNEAWLAPPLGPIRIGNQAELGRWLGQQEDISTPYLHVETILKKMRSGYRLEEQPDAIITLANGENRNCIHLKATYRGADKAVEQETSRAPTTIELWSDVETGIALRLDGHWDDSEETRRRRVVIEYLEEPELPENWFSVEAHVSGFRRRIRFDE